MSAEEGMMMSDGGEGGSTIETAVSDRGDRHYERESESGFSFVRPALCRPSSRAYEDGIGTHPMCEKSAGNRSIVALHPPPLFFFELAKGSGPLLGWGEEEIGCLLLFSSSPQRAYYWREHCSPVEAPIWLLFAKVGPSRQRW